MKATVILKRQKSILINQINVLKRQKSILINHYVRNNDSVVWNSYLETDSKIKTYEATLQKICKVV